jgi:hypothetical protein
MKVYRGMDVWIHIFWTSALAAGEWSASLPGRYKPGETAPSTHFIGGWVDPRDSLDDMEKRKFLTLLGLNSDPLVVQSVASRYTDYTIPALPVTHGIRLLSSHPYARNLPAFSLSPQFNPCKRCAVYLLITTNINQLNPHLRN